MPNRVVKDADTGKLRFYTVEMLGPNQSLTPEGFLVCHNVPIARTGTQLYLADEVPIESAGNGEVRVFREPADVFRAETIASFEGKPVTMNHPESFVTPENWQELAVGVTQNVRRGEGPDLDLLVADLMITERQAIEAVRSKMANEVSCGYEADYEQDIPGMGFQRNILGNHVALVPKGRAGPRVSIQDEDMTMASKIRAFLDKLSGTKDPAEIAKMVKDAEAEEKAEEEKKAKEAKDSEEKERKEAMDSALKPIMDALKEMKDDIEELKKKQAGTEDDDDPQSGDKDYTGDTILSAEVAGKCDVGKVYTGQSVGDAFRDTVARAEILSPGIQIPTADSAPRKGTIATLQRQALTKAIATDSVKGAVEPLLAGRTVDKLTVDELATVFVGASEIAKRSNNSSGMRSGVTKDTFGRAGSIADINKRNREFWAAKTGSK